MEYDNDARDKKKLELQALIRSAVPSSALNPDQLAESVLSSFVRLTPPTQPERVIAMITMRPSGAGGGRSYKPGNIYLNMRKLMDVVPEVAISVVAGTSAPCWLLPFIGLRVWNKLRGNAKEDLSEAEATIIYALWKHRNGEDKISEDDGFERTNSTRTAAGLSPLDRGAFDRSVNRLLKIECIEIEEGIIWLREWICIKY